jgi:membrane-associated phospholipid phosphatase
MAAGEWLARWAERRSGGKTVGPRASFATRALPLAGRTEAPSGHATRSTRAVWSGKRTCPLVFPLFVFYPEETRG